MAPNKYKKQCRIIIPCILHSFIKIHNEFQNDNDALFVKDKDDDENEDTNYDQSDQFEVDDTHGGDIFRAALTHTLWVYSQNQSEA
jgi:hypothetical protein